MKKWIIGSFLMLLTFAAVSVVFMEKDLKHQNVKRANINQAVAKESVPNVEPVQNQLFVAKQPTKGLPVYSRVDLMSDISIGTPEELLQTADIVFVGKFVKENKTLVGGGIIRTESNFKVKRIIKGTLTTVQEKNGIDLQYYGGEVTLDDYYNSMSEAEKSDPKAGNSIKSIPAEERKKQKVVSFFEHQANKDKDPNAEMLVFLANDKEGGCYFVISGDFGMRRIDNKGNVFNPLSNNYEEIRFLNN